MPLTDEQKDALQSAVSAFDSPEAFADALQSQAQPYFQEPFNRGHSTATGDKSETINELQSQVADLQGKLEQKDDQIQTLQEEKPDVDEAVQSVRENELQPVREELESLKSELSQSARRDAKRRVQERLADQLGDDFLAESIVNSRLSDDHIQVTDEFSARFLQDPERGVPLDAGENDPADIMADRLLEEVPDKYKATKEQGGKRSTQPSLNQNGQQPSSGGFTKAQLRDDPSAMGKFFEQFEGDQEEAVQAFQNLPDE